MDESNKLWVIDLGEDFVVEKHVEKQPEIPRPIPAPSMAPKPAISRPRPKARTAGSGQLHFALMIALSYLLGPFALLLWSRGRRHRLRAEVSVFSGLACAAVAWQWQNILTFASNGALLVPVLVAVGVISIMAFSSWALALHLAFVSRTRSHTVLPGWTRSAWGVTGLGLIAPGLGLFLNGHRKRAVATLWSLWPVFPAAVILAHSGWTWQWLSGARHNAGQLQTLEFVILGSVAVLVLAYLGWLTQALSGLYLKSRRNGPNAARHGDRFALALVAAVVTLAVVLPPREMASFLHNNVEYLDQQGYQVIPLQLARAAHGLAPRDASYTETLARLEGPPTPENLAPETPRDPVQDGQVYYGTMAPHEGPSGD